MGGITSRLGQNELLAAGHSQPETFLYKFTELVDRQRCRRACDLNYSSVQ
jgi:hypothetical protein